MGLNLNRRRWTVAVVGSLLVGSGLLVFGATLWEHFARGRAESFTTEGFRSWQEGHIREARLAWQSASHLAPDLPRPWQLMARMELQQGNLALAREIFSRLITGSGDEEARSVNARLYVDSLLATGHFAEAAYFAYTEFERSPKSDRKVWSTVAFHGARIAGAGAILARPSPNPVTAPNLAALRHLIAAQARFQEGRLDEVRAELDGVMAPQLEWATRVAGSRLALALGDRSKARVLIYGGSEPLNPAEQLAARFLLGETPSYGEARQLARQIGGAMLPSRVVLDAVGALLPAESAELPALLEPTTTSVIAGQTDSVVAGLWLLWEINRPGKRDNPWKALLTERIHFEPLPLASTRLGHEQFAAVINRLPLARDTVVSLLARIDELKTGGLGGLEDAARL
jgi:hypothetical protein